MEIIVLAIIVLITLPILLIASGLRNIKSDQRLAVFTMGKFSGVIKPKWQYIIPFLQETSVVNLTKHIPNWEILNAIELDEKVKQLVGDKPTNAYK